MATFSERVKDLRIKNNFSQQALADLIDVNKQTISQYERGVRFPTKENLEALCDIFNVSSDFLLGREDVSPLLLSEDELTAMNIFRDIECASDKSPIKTRSQVLHLLSLFSALDENSRCEIIKRAEELLQLEEYRKSKMLPENNSVSA